MNRDALGAVGEIVGALAVILTLLYVARQIHQANIHAQAQARYLFKQSYGDLNTAISNNRDVASIFRRVVESGETSYEIR